jgi:hypothetical protein
VLKEAQTVAVRGKPGFVECRPIVIRDVPEAAGEAMIEVFGEERLRPFRFDESQKMVTEIRLVCIR